MGRLLMRNHSGITLVEVLVSAGIFLIAVVGILSSYVKFLELDEVSRGSAIAVQGLRSKIEAVKNTSFVQIYTTYNNSTFTIPGLNGMGVVYVNNSNPKLLEVKTVYSWRLSNGRIVGEDKNLNGVLNTGEDKNANGQIDSYAQIVTQIFG